MCSEDRLVGLHILHNLPTHIPGVDVEPPGMILASRLMISHTLEPLLGRKAAGRKWESREGCWTPVAGPVWERKL